MLKFKDNNRVIGNKLPELAEIFWGNEGTPDKVKFVEVGNPFGILFIGLLAIPKTIIDKVEERHNKLFHVLFVP